MDSDSIAIIALLILAILCVGEPDLLDAIRHRIDPTPCTCVGEAK